MFGREKAHQIVGEGECQDDQSIYEHDTPYPIAMASHEGKEGREDVAAGPSAMAQRPPLHELGAVVVDICLIVPAVGMKSDAQTTVGAGGLILLGTRGLSVCAPCAPVRERS